MLKKINEPKKSHITVNMAGKRWNNENGPLSKSNLKHMKHRCKEMPSSRGLQAILITIEVTSEHVYDSHARSSDF